jgi:hypothetical protein
MRSIPYLLAVIAWAFALPVMAQEFAPERAVVEASAPSDLSVTVYRDPNRDDGEEMDADWPEGFAMISETRTVTLPAGQSKIRFDGVAEGMVAVSAIVTGLPEGTIEKNRDADLLSPAALVNGALGNRVQITRTNPGTGRAQTEEAIVRTRADGGLVFETSEGFEAVRCAGLPEKITFNGIPRGLSAKPVYSVNTSSASGGTYEIVLTYISWGFDWQANYVGTLGESVADRGDRDEFSMQLLSWLTLVNNNGQSFEDANLQVVAGKLNVDSEFEELAEAPQAKPLTLKCYPIGSTAAGSPIPHYGPVPPPPPSTVEMDGADVIIVAAQRRQTKMQASPAPVAVVTASEEDLGDLKLYRVPERVTVSAKGIKQVAFLNEDAVKARYLYNSDCQPWDWDNKPDFEQAQMLLVTKNEEAKGLGMALPQGGLAVFEPAQRGPLLVAETNLRDYARTQDVELEIGESAQVQMACARLSEDEPDEIGRKWSKMRASVTNANPHPVTLRFWLGEAAEWDIKFPRHKTRIKDGYRIVEMQVAAQSEREFDWKIRRPKGWDN